MRTGSAFSVKELTTKYTIRYLEDMDALNILRPHVLPLATEEIPKIIEIVQGLVDKGFAYAAAGDVYFRVRNMADYGKLSHRTLDSMQAGARIEIGEQKGAPDGFCALESRQTRRAAMGQPLGKRQARLAYRVFSAMSLQYLGEQIDIHGGGQDLIFPHHENEIAQSECFTGKKPFARNLDA